MEISQKERLVLLGLRLNRQQLRAEKPFHPHGSFRERARIARRLVQIDSAKKGWARITLGAWLGHRPSPSESVQFHRVYKRLERDGLIHIRGIRATDAKLTPAGEAVIADLIEHRP